MTDYTKVAIETLLPHSPPMVLLDRVLSYSENCLIAEVCISESSMFYDSDIGGVPAWAGIEYMAQSIAALAGIKAKRAEKPIKIGFLLGTRKLILEQKIFRSGGVYCVMVEQLFRDESGLASFECKIQQGESLCVWAKVNVFETDEKSDE